MKKAKEYAEVILSHESTEDQIDESVKVVREMILEIKELTLTRNATTNSAMRSIINEQSKKWNTICRIVNAQTPILNEEVFIKCLYKLIPSTKSLNIETHNSIDKINRRR